MPKKNDIVPINEDEKKPLKISNRNSQFPPDMLDWVLSPSADMSESTEVAITNVLRDRKKRVQVFLTGMARQRIRRIVDLIEKMPDVESELLRQGRLETAKTSDLIRLFATMAQQVDNAAEFLRAFVSDDELRSDPLTGRIAPSGVIEDSDDDEDNEGSTKEAEDIANELSTRSRRKVQGLVRKVLDAIHAVGNDKTIEMNHLKEEE